MLLCSSDATTASALANIEPALAHLSLNTADYSKPLVEKWNSLSQEGIGIERYPAFRINQLSDIVFLVLCCTRCLLSCYLVDEVNDTLLDSEFVQNVPQVTWLQLLTTQGCIAIFVAHVGGC